MLLDRPLATWYVNEGGPIALLRVWCDGVQGLAINTGHFFPEEAPEPVADALNRFLDTAESSHVVRTDL